MSIAEPSYLPLPPSLPTADRLRARLRLQRAGPSRTRGISMVEFVIVFPFATLFVLGLIQVGMLYMAKLTLNHATFMAARVGSMHNAKEDSIREALVRGLSPFYQDSTITNDHARLAKAYGLALVDSKVPYRLNVDVLNPSPDAFRDFGVTDSKAKVTYIPNDNLEHRQSTLGTRSKLNIRDANLLKIRVVYAYEMKVPLIRGVVARMMCSGWIGVEAYGNVRPWNALYAADPSPCLKYYSQDRIPIESFAIVEMQSRAEKPS